MELVRGIKITEYCDQNKLPTRERLGLFILVCQAIQHAHQKGIIHRDIKPSNILVTLHDGVPVPKVIDFGIAKATQQELTDKTVFTQFQQFMGTPAYISPEQAEMSGLDIDTRADIYSLGVLLYELLVGQTPFDAKEMAQGGLDALRKVIREKEPLRPSTKLNTLPGELRTTAGKRRQTEVGKLVHQLQGDLDWIVMKCLEKDRTRRYDTANGLTMDIQRHLAHEPVLARPPTAAYRLQKAFRRNKLVFTAAAVVAVTLVAGIGVSTWQTFTARRAQLETEAARKGEQQQRLEAQAAQKTAETHQQRADAQASKALESQQHSRRLLYAADMNLSQQTLKRNNLGQARRLLERHRPLPGEEDIRGWEWRYLWQLTQSSALVTLTNRVATGFAVSFSPDGSRLVVNWNGGRVDLWDVPGQRWIRALTDREYPHHEGRVAFSPVGNLVAATSEPKVVTLYDLDSGRESILWRAADSDGWTVRDLGFSRDGSLLIIYAGTYPHEPRDEVSVVNVSSSRIESRYPRPFNSPHIHEVAQLSPDNRRLYLARADSATYSYSIQCIDRATGQELWQTQPQRDLGLTTMAVSPDGRVLVSGSGYEDPTIRVWDTTTGQMIRPLEGHTSWVCQLVFSRDGRRLISAGGDQSIRFWDTGTWTETQVLRGHTDELHTVAISDSARLVASSGRDGNLILWRADGKSTSDGHRRLSENFLDDEVLRLDQSRVLLLPPGRPPELVDLKQDSAGMSLPVIGSSTNVLGWFGTNILCFWNGTNQVLVHQWGETEFIQRGAITLDSQTRPHGFAYHTRRRLVAWTEGAQSKSVYLVDLAAPDRRIEMRSDVSGLARFFFSNDGDYLVARSTTKGGFLRAWNVLTGHLVVSIDKPVWDVGFAADGRIMVVVIVPGDDHQIRFYDLLNPDRAPRFVSGRYFSGTMTVSPDGRLVASSTHGGLVHLIDPVKAELIEPLHAHMNAVHGTAFSPDGRRLISTSGGREAVKLWDVGTRQELLTLAGSGSMLSGQWTADGDVILAGPPWQAWRAPSWEEIAATEATK